MDSTCTYKLSWDENTDCKSGKQTWQCHENQLLHRQWPDNNVIINSDTSAEFSTDHDVLTTSNSLPTTQ
ncbi:unnamed protein product [Adineta steineri]|uniref:Uncharacterized protein n=1 Tax=Adineta steineri TaxID=433720 RepID=A0A814H7M6_9BILA|nr:unnamed protein product [Adineta steineri]